MAGKDVEVTRQGKSIKVRRVGSSSSANGEDKEPGLVMRTLTGLISRLQLANRAGLRFDSKRNYYDVFGYKRLLENEDFLGKYQRQDIASRIVDAPPGATWSNPPGIKNNDAIKTKWDALVLDADLWSAMYRADRLGRINRFAIMLFGFDDAGSFESQITKSSELLYVRAIGSRMITKVTFNKDERSPRFGLPETYEISLDDPAQKTILADSVEVKSLKTLKVHWSRTVHIVDNALEDVTVGTPIMEKCFNLLDDLLKVSGGTSETYWLTANRGMQANIDEEMEIDPADAAALSDEIEEYQHQLRRFIRTRGVDLKVLESSVPNPKEIYDMIMGLLSGTTGIPRRILLGAEAGQLASEQDRANWAERIEERRRLFAEPVMLKPTMALFQTVGLVPEGDFEWDWPSAFIQNPLEEGQTMAQKARTIGNISRQTGNKAPMQITSRDEAREILGLEGSLPEAEIIEPPEEPAPRIPGRPVPGETPEEEGAPPGRNP